MFKSCQDAEIQPGQPETLVGICYGAVTEKLRLRKFRGIRAIVQFGLRIRPVKGEIPSASLRAGASLRLESGYAQDDKVV